MKVEKITEYKPEYPGKKRKAAIGAIAAAAALIAGSALGGRLPGRRDGSPRGHGRARR